MYDILKVCIDSTISDVLAMGDKMIGAETPYYGIDIYFHNKTI